MRRRLLPPLLILLLAAGGGPCAVEATEADRPNVLLIVVDDLGFADLGSFGGEIATPHLDRLASEGIRFTNFTSASMCSPARAMLLTGVDSHLAGFGNMLEELSPNQKGRPGYEGYLPDRIVTLPELLRDSGYRTYMTGKWHLGSGEGKGAASRGFGRSFVLDSGGASHFADMRPAYAPSPDIRANYREDGKPLDTLPADFEYSSEYYVDRMIRYLEEDAGDDRPFFAYLSFTAPHWPLQAPDEAIRAQSGRYDAGYDVLAAARLARQKSMGIVPESATRADRSPKEKPWDSLGEAERMIEIRAMEVYAAMVAEVDRHTGRLIDYLERRGELDDTAIFFLSDNGPEGHDLDETWPMEAFPEIRRTIDTTHDFSYEAMGHEGSYVLYGPNWANAGSPAFRLHKGFPTEGGTRVAAFVRYKGLVTSPSISDAFVFVADVTPTIVELAGVDPPGSKYRGRDIEPMSGRSFLPLLSGRQLEETSRTTAMELLGKRAVRRGEWKLVHMPPPHGAGRWQLFDVHADPGESLDLATRYPDTVADLVRAWDDYANRNGVILPDWVSGY